MQHEDACAVYKKHGARYKRIRRRPAKEPCPEVYALKVKCLGELERLAKLELIDLYYGDESRVSIDPCVPYGWQFKGETAFMPAAKGAGVNCFALLSRVNDLLFETTRQRITSQFIIERFERLSFSIKKMTVVVLDNARVHTSQQVQERRRFWQQRGLFVFYLPPYSPHLNIAETLWRKLKYEWLQPSDYVTADGLFYRVRQALAAVGSMLKIRFSEFSLGLS
ncbi:MAG: IS630 family transposase [Acidobacteria bacterium]|nr:MAG: IS630 family transposase [Acidobacteriota bacterium]